LENTKESLAAIKILAGWVVPTPKIAITKGSASRTRQRKKKRKLGQPQHDANQSFIWGRVVLSAEEKKATPRTTPRTETVLGSRSTKFVDFPKRVEQKQRKERAQGLTMYIE
jgi:hypothetical protein